MARVKYARTIIKSLTTDEETELISLRPKEGEEMDVVWIIPEADYETEIKGWVGTDLRLDVDTLKIPPAEKGIEPKIHLTPREEFKLTAVRKTTNTTSVKVYIEYERITR